jgi:photosystem II stability/assembly factor-like uncharacterized protein
MTKKRTRDASRRGPRRTQGRRGWLAGAALAIVGALALAAFLLAPRPPEQTAWAHLGSEDVHSLAFVGDDPDHLLFGHHGGLSRSRDGGLTWQSLSTRTDAMAMRPAEDGSIVVAGHEVLVASRDGGETWEPISADLPSLDIHGFTRDPGDPARMWGYLATGGLWETRDFGTTWERVREDNVLFPLTVRNGGVTRLIGLATNGLVASDDGGRTWEGRATPQTYPLTSLAGTKDGSVLYAGSIDALYRSDDGGRSWAKTDYAGSTLAIATAGDGATVAVVSRETDFFRSPDGGRSWPGPP